MDDQRAMGELVKLAENNSPCYVCARGEYGIGERKLSQQRRPRLPHHGRDGGFARQQALYPGSARELCYQSHILESVYSTEYMLLEISSDQNAWAIASILNADSNATSNLSVRLRRVKEGWNKTDEDG